MAMEICPKCGTLKEMNLTISKRKEKQSDGTDITIETRAYHCAECKIFVKSEESME